MNAKVTRKVRSWFVVEAGDRSVFVAISKGAGKGIKTEAEALEEGKSIMAALGW